MTGLSRRFCVRRLGKIGFSACCVLTPSANPLESLPRIAPPRTAPWSPPILSIFIRAKAEIRSALLRQTAGTRNSPAQMRLDLVDRVLGQILVDLGDDLGFDIGVKD